MTRKIRVGSRESALAMVQSKWVINEIQREHPELEFEIVGIKTKGDFMLDSRLDKIGGKGLFIKELEIALMDNYIDMAVHSLKDLPAEIPKELTIAALSKREDPRDVIVTADGSELRKLKKGAVIGTSSIRRELQIANIRPDLKFKLLRGNVLTRISKLKNGEYDAIVLAAAGLNRLGKTDIGAQYLGIEEMIPAVGQGILAIETRRDENIRYLLDSVNCANAALSADAERAFMIRLNGGCTTPMAAHSVIEGETMKIYGMLALNGMEKMKTAIVKGNKYDAVKLGEELAGILISGSRICTEQWIF